MANQIGVLSGDSFRLLDASELELFNRLREAMPALIVFAQVSMSQVYYLHSKRIDTLTRFGDIGRKSIDFLLCRRNDNGIVAAVALKTVVSDSPFPSDADESKFSALKEAGIPLLVYVRDRLPDIATIRKAMIPMVDGLSRYDRRQTSQVRQQGMHRFY